MLNFRLISRYDILYAGEPRF